MRYNVTLGSNLFVFMSPCELYDEKQKQNIDNDRIFNVAIDPSNIITDKISVIFCAVLKRLIRQQTTLGRQH